MSFNFLLLFLSIILLVSSEKHKKVKYHDEIINDNDADESKADVVLSITKDENKDTETVDLVPKKAHDRKSTKVDDFDHSKLKNKKTQQSDSESGDKMSTFLNDPKYQEPINPRVKNKFGKLLEETEKYAEMKDHGLQQYVHHHELEEHEKNKARSNDNDKNGDVDDEEESKDDKKKFTIINKFNIIPPPQPHHEPPPPEPVKIQKLEFEEPSAPPAAPSKPMKAKVNVFEKVIDNREKHTKGKKLKVQRKKKKDDEILRIASLEVDKVIHEIFKRADRLDSELHRNGQRESQFSPGRGGNGFGNANSVYSGLNEPYNSGNDFYGQAQGQFKGRSSGQGESGNPYYDNYGGSGSGQGSQNQQYDEFGQSGIGTGDYDSQSQMDESEVDEALEEATEVISNIKNLDERVLKLLQGEELDISNTNTKNKNPENTMDNDNPDSTDENETDTEKCH